jgi:hypothetical protein
MRTVQPRSLTTEELIKHADLLLTQGVLPEEWQKEILHRLEKLLYSDGNTIAQDPNQLSLF